MDGGPSENTWYNRLFYVCRSAKELSKVFCRIQVCRVEAYSLILLVLRISLGLPNTQLGVIFAIFIRFTQTLRRLKDIYECYILSDDFLRKLKKKRMKMFKLSLIGYLSDSEEFLEIR